MALSAKQKLILKELAANYFVITNACNAAKISRQTLYEWLKIPEFKKKADEIENDLLNVIEDRLKAQAINKQPWAIKFFLSRRHSSYKPKLEVSQGYEFEFDGEH